MRPIDADVLKQHIDKLPALPDGNFAGNHSALKALINMQPTIEPSTNCSEFPNNSDTVSRQAVLDAIVQCTNCGDEDTLREYVLKHSLDNGWTGGILEALDAVKDLPPAQPEPHEGHWIRRDCGLDIECKCSVCGYKDFVEPHDTYWFKRNYCPNCGAKMINK